LNPNYGEAFQNLNRPHFSGPVEADITIETVNNLSQCNHLGLISTEAINEWLSEIPSLHTIVIFLKQIFKNYHFNITYEGGLNTFAMIVLLVSYIRHAKL
jgi:DNA polymerase sigma